MFLSNGSVHQVRPRAYASSDVASMNAVVAQCVREQWTTNQRGGSVAAAAVSRLRDELGKQLGALDRGIAHNAPRRLLLVNCAEHWHTFAKGAAAHTLAMPYDTTGILATASTDDAGDATDTDNAGATGGKAAPAQSTPSYADRAATSTAPAVTRTDGTDGTDGGGNTPGTTGTGTDHAADSPGTPSTAPGTTPGTAGGTAGGTAHAPRMFPLNIGDSTISSGLAKAINFYGDSVVAIAYARQALAWSLALQGQADRKRGLRRRRKQAREATKAAADAASGPGADDASNNTAARDDATGGATNDDDDTDEDGDGSVAGADAATGGDGDGDGDGGDDTADDTADEGGNNNDGSDSEEEMSNVISDDPLRAAVWSCRNVLAFVLGDNGQYEEACALQEIVLEYVVERKPPPATSKRESLDSVCLCPPYDPWGCAPRHLRR